MVVRYSALVPTLALLVPVAAGLFIPFDDAPAAVTTASGTEPAVFVGNNWEGTADVIRFDADAGTFDTVARINIIPDIEERYAEMLLDPERMGYFLGIRMLIGEGNDQFVDDMYSADDGRLLVVSRPSLRDVVGLDMETGEVEWRFVVDGQRSDHMAVSPDSSRVAVSASTGNVVHILDVLTGEEVGRFASGDSPHENVYSHDGSKIYHASIGLVYTPLDAPLLDTSKGDRFFMTVDAETNEVLSNVDMGQKLAEAGFPGMSAAVRPMTHSPDEHYVYLQVSFFHGFVEYDTVAEKVVRVVPLPNFVPGLPREQYLLDSAHHGIAMNAAGDTLCIAGTMSDYGAIVDRQTLHYSILQKPEGAKPYWSTLSADGEHCLVSWSGLDQISAISYETGEEVAVTDVGYHPQRIRNGEIPAGWTGMD